MLFEHTPNSLFVKDLEGRYVDVNPAYERMIGMPRERVVGCTDAQLFPREHAEQFRAADLRVIATGEAVEIEENTDLFGDPRTSLTHKFPIRDAHGAIIATGGILMDYTQRRRVQAQLAAYVMRQRLMLATTPAILWSTDADLRITSAEGRGLRAMDVEGPNSIGSPLESILKTGSPGMAAHWRALAGETVGYEVTYGGREFASTVGPMRDQDGRTVGVAGVAMDVSDERRARRQLAESESRYQRYLERLQQVSRRLVSLQEAERREIAAELHDRVGQSLSALGIQLSVLDALVAPAAPAAQALLREAQQILDEAGSAVRGVISELRPEALHEYGLVAALRSLEARVARRFGLALSVMAPDENLRLPAAVEASLYRICQEAIANVSKHAQADRIEITFRATARGAALRVSDNGCGFRMSSLLEPGKLSRWGLLMMRERADSISAPIRVSSAPGRGTSICVSWRERRAHPRPAG